MHFDAAWRRGCASEEAKAGTFFLVGLSFMCGSCRRAPHKRDDFRADAFFVEEEEQTNSEEFIDAHQE